MVRSLLERTFYSTSCTVESILRHIADRETVKSLLRLVINPTIDFIKKKL